MEERLVEQWVSAQQAADAKGISKTAVTKAIREKRLPAQNVGGFYLISRAALAAWQPAGKGRRDG